MKPTAKNHAKAIIAILIMVAIVMTVIGVHVSASSQTAHAVDTSNVLRLHIIANSDSETDQKLKLLVRDAVLNFERTNTCAAYAEDANSAERMLMDNGEGLLNAIRSVLTQNNAPYDAQLMLGDFEFPDRTYGDQLYPAGTYHAVRILLGEAKGKNWWCVMFPPLCIVEAQEGEIDYDEPIRFESLFAKAFNYIKIHLFGSREN